MIARLRERGLVRSTRRPARPPRTLAWAASIAIAFLLGALATRLVGAPSGTHLLLLERGSDSLTSGEVEARVAEYTAWAREVDAAGALVTADHLLPGGWRLGGEDGERRLLEDEREGPPSGFFLIEADSEEEALRIARGCPHLAHGGIVRLRAIDRR